MKGYKVVRSKGTEFESYIVNSGSPFFRKASVTYRINEWAKPQKKCGPLAIFKTIPDAMRCIKQNWWTGYYIFSCEYKPYTRKAAYLFFYSEDMGRNHEVKDLPLGTVLASRVKLLEEVQI